MLEIIALGASFCALTEPGAQSVRAGNLFAFDPDGNELWRASATFAVGDRNVFVDVQADPQDAERLVARDRDGHR